MHTRDIDHWNHLDSVENYMVVLKQYTANLIQTEIEFFQFTIEMLSNQLDVNQISLVVSE